MLPNSFLPSFPGPVNDFNPAQLFVPAPVPGKKSDLKVVISAERTKQTHMRGSLSQLLSEVGWTEYAMLSEQA